MMLSWVVAVHCIHEQNESFFEKCVDNFIKTQRLSKLTLLEQYIKFQQLYFLHLSRIS